MEKKKRGKILGCPETLGLARNPYLEKSSKECSLLRHAHIHLRFYICD
jgi:hypothetical protein